MVGTALSAAPVYSLSQFMAPLEQAFGWSRTEISSGLTIGLLLGIVLAPFVGRLVDRVNVRVLAIPGVILGGLCFAAFSLTSRDPAVWAGLWLANAALGAVVSPTLWLAAAGAAVTTKRNLALGLSLCGTGVAAALGPPLARAAVDAFDWRTAYQLLALGWGGAALVLTLLFLFDKRPHTGRTAQAAQSPAPRASARQLLLTPTFIKMAVVVFGAMATAAGTLIHLAPALAESGLTKDRAAALAGAAGLAAIAGKLCVGWVFDRASLRVLSCTVMGALGFAAVVLATGSGQAEIALLGCIALGLALGSILSLVACVSSSQFDARDFGLAYGALGAATSFGGALGPLALSFIRDATGSYAAGFWAGAGVAAVAALLLSTLAPQAAVKADVAPPEPVTPI